MVFIKHFFFFGTLDKKLVLLYHLVNCVCLGVLSQITSNSYLFFWFRDPFPSNIDFLSLFIKRINGLTNFDVLLFNFV